MYNRNKTLLLMCILFFLVLRLVNVYSSTFTMSQPSLNPLHLAHFLLFESNEKDNIALFAEQFQQFSENMNFSFENGRKQPGLHAAVRMSSML